MHLRHLLPFSRGAKAVRRSFDVFLELGDRSVELLEAYSFGLQSLPQRFHFRRTATYESDGYDWCLLLQESQEQPERNDLRTGVGVGMVSGILEGVLMLTMTGFDIGVAGAACTMMAALNEVIDISGDTSV